MTELEKLKVQLVHIETALLSIVAVLQDMQPPHVQEVIDHIINRYFEARTEIEETGEQT